jgi:hypothetical protein
MRRAPQLWRTLPGWRQQTSTLILSNVTCYVKRARAGPSIGSTLPSALETLPPFSTLLSVWTLRRDIPNCGCSLGIPPLDGQPCHLCLEITHGRAGCQAHRLYSSAAGPYAIICLLC